MKKLNYLTLFLLLSIGVKAQWKYTNFPDGANVSKIAKNGNTLFAATYFNIYTSTNEGANWTRSIIAPAKFIRTQMFAFRQSDAFIAAVDGVYKSTDQGASWVNLFKTYRGHLNCITIKEDTIYAAGNNKCYRSFDYGVHWDSVLITATNPQVNFTGILFRGNTLFASFANSFYTSIDKGSTWQKVNSTPVIYSFEPVVAFGNKLLIAQPSNFLYASSDEGKNWTQLSISANAIYIDNSTAYAAAKDGVYSSSDGLTWTKIANNPTNINYAVIAVHGSNFYLGTNRGVYTSANTGITWTFSSNGFKDLGVSRMIQNTTTIYASTARGLMASTDNGQNWNNLTPDMATSALAIAGNSIYVGKNEGVMFSKNNGLTWQQCDPSFKNNVYDFLIVNNTIFAGTDNGICISSDGINWDYAYTDTTKFPTMWGVYCFATDGDYLYAGSDGKGMFRSTDHGTSWHAIKNGLPTDLVVHSIKMKGQRIVISTWYGVFISTDKGDTWKSIGPSEDEFTDASPVYNDLFTGLYDGRLFLSNDEGANWLDISSGLPYGNIEDVIRKGDKFFVATISGGVWYRPVAELPVGIQEQFSDRNAIKTFPNPNNGLFTISDVGENSTIEIVNILGKRVYTVNHVSGKQIIDLRDQANGVYFLEVTDMQGKNFSSKIVIR